MHVSSYFFSPLSLPSDADDTYRFWQLKKRTTKFNNPTKTVAPCFCFCCCLLFLCCRLFYVPTLFFPTLKTQHKNETIKSRAKGDGKYRKKEDKRGEKNKENATATENIMRMFKATTVGCTSFCVSQRLHFVGMKNYDLLVYYEMCANPCCCRDSLA